MELLRSKNVAKLQEGLMVETALPEDLRSTLVDILLHRQGRHHLALLNERRHRRYEDHCSESSAPYKPRLGARPSYSWVESALCRSGTSWVR